MANRHLILISILCLLIVCRLATQFYNIDSNCIEKELYKKKPEMNLHFLWISYYIANGVVVPFGLRAEMRTSEEKYIPHLRMEMFEDIKRVGIEILERNESYNGAL